LRLILSTNGLHAAGGSETYLLTVASHLQRLGHDVTLHANEVDAGLAASLAWVKIADGVHELPAEADGILVQDAICALQLAERLPGVPQLFLAHSSVHDVQLPPQVAGVCAAAVAFNERVAGRLRAQALPLPLHRLTQPVDLDVFAPRVAVRERALKVLSFGNYLPPERRAMLAAACEELGLELAVRGALTEPSDDPAALMLEADIVVGYGRCIVEAMACGRAAYVWDHMGGDGWVTAASYPVLEADGFGGRATGAGVDAGRLVADLAAYDPEMGVVNRDIAIREHGPRQHAQALVGLLRDAGAPAGGLPPLAELARMARVAWDLERRAMGLSRRVEGEVAARREEVAAHRARSEALAEELRQARAAAAVAEAESAVAQARAGAAERELTAARAKAAELKATRRYRMAAALARPLDRAREVARRGGAPAADGPADDPGDPPGAVAATGEPELAVVVFSHRAQPTLVRAVRSVLAQDIPVELLVVNSGGGDAPVLLAAAGLGDVRVVEHPERLFPGGACNVGLRETAAPFVAFVAGDLVLRPGWVAGRLLRHRAGRAAVAAALVPIEPAGAAGRSSYLLLNHRRTPWTPPGEALRFSLSYDRRLFERYGVFREDLRAGEDFDMQERFGPEVDIEFAPDVQAAHHGPEGVPAMLRDQFARGRRMAYTRAWAEGADWRGRIARNALRNAGHGARAGLAGADSPRRLAQVAGAAPLLVPGAAAYAAGALTAPLTGARRRRRTRRLIALVPFKDELHYLPGLFENLAPHVDGIVALDDGSSDGSAEYVAGRPELLELLPGRGGAWDEPGNRERLIRAAWEHGADWLYGIDADERVERHFRARAERILARAEAAGEDALYVRLRELWDAPDRMRVDGVWGTKRKACLVRARRDHDFDRRAFHGHWAPRNDRHDRFPVADLLVYHLRMVHAADREARRARYEALDPEARWQSIGYAYLTSTEHLVTAPLPYGRDFTPLRDR